eukprot:scaffold3300_cov97-Isochrysis_galbana.AAC.4
MAATLPALLIGRLRRRPQGGGLGLIESDCGGKYEARFSDYPMRRIAAMLTRCAFGWCCAIFFAGLLAAAAGC